MMQREGNHFLKKNLFSFSLFFCEKPRHEPIRSCCGEILSESHLDLVGSDALSNAGEDHDGSQVEIRRINSKSYTFLERYFTRMLLQEVYK